MRAYKKRILKDAFERQISRRVETRDAILWDILPEQHVCRIKIQGSDELITARYNQNWENTPSWMKPGNAVRVVHRGGIRGHIEITGHGQNIPTAIAGGTMTPPGTTPVDAILTGMQALADSPASMLVYITAGTYRISGTTYTLAAGDLFVMAADSELLMSATSPYVMGEGYAGSVEIDAAPAAGQFRIDLIVIGIDGVIDYVKGTAATEPTQPDTPSGHLLIATVLVAGGATSITQNYINRAYVDPVASYLVMEIDDDELEWDETEPPVQATTNIYVRVKDQYGNPYSYGYGTGLHMTLTIIYGNGEVWSSEDGWSESSVGKNFTGSYALFQYRRGNTEGDISPFLMAEMPIGKMSLAISGHIDLLDIDGNIMAG